MREVLCSQCSAHLGWMCDAGPCGSHYCDACYDINEEDEEQIRDE